MGELKHIAFENEAKEIKERVNKYWTNRADSFFDQRQNELESNKAIRWQNEIETVLPSKKPLKILNVGCGAGFFEVILGRQGHSVVGIDLTEEMITKARNMVKLYGLSDKNITLKQMDAEKLEFENDTFDVVITRNLTWTLPHPIEAYKEWYRVLKKGGLLLNFDAEYAKGAHNLKDSNNLAHKSISNELKDECHNIYHMLTVSTLDRPKWDEEVLSKLGYINVETDIEFGERIFIEHDEFYIPDKMFFIKAQK